MRIVFSILLGFTLISPAAAAPQGLSEVVAPGTRIRATTACGTDPTGVCVHVGTAERISPAGLSVVTDQKAAWLDAAALLRLEASGGTRSRWVAGAAVGAAGGAAGTFFAVRSGGSTSLCDPGSNQDALTTTECTGIVLLGAGLGASVGALIGSFVRSERWIDLELGVTPRPTGSVGGVRVRISGVASL